jgi:OOP family OmpA-OmpF porin
VLVAKLLTVVSIVFCGLSNQTIVAADQSLVQAGHSPAPKAAAKQCAGKIRPRGLKFSGDDAAIHNDHSVVLDEVAQFLLETCPNQDVRITGHTDEPGSDAYNLELSEKRAQAVKNYLVEHGVAAERLSVVGKGNRKNKAPSDTEAGRALNSRVTLRFVQHKE